MEINQLSHLILNSEQQHQLKDDDELLNERTSKLLNLFKLNQAAAAAGSSNLTESHQMILLNQTNASPIFNLGMFEYSSESLLQNCLVGNYETVKDILENGDFNVNVTRKLQYNRSVVKFSELAAQNAAYNTYSGGEMPKAKIDLEICDEVKSTLYNCLMTGTLLSSLKKKVSIKMSLYQSTLNSELFGILTIDSFLIIVKTYELAIIWILGCWQLNRKFQ